MTKIVGSGQPAVGGGDDESQPNGNEEPDWRNEREREEEEKEEYTA